MLGECVCVYVEVVVVVAARRYPCRPASTSHPNLDKMHVSLYFGAPDRYSMPCKWNTYKGRAEEVTGAVVSSQGSEISTLRFTKWITWNILLWGDPR